MELPQPSRPFGPEGRKATHDFLSLRTHSPGQHDPRPSSHVGGSCLKTHNFLQPLEKDDTIKEDHAVDVTVDKPPPQVPPPLLSAEHVLPGGIGTYSISHISYFNQRMPKSEGTVYATPAPAATSSNDRNDENSNCSSYTAGSGGGFTLWGESSSAIKGKAQKENMGDINFTKESMLKSGQWPKEMPSESSSNHQNNFSSRSSSQPPAHRSQSFLDMIKSAKGGPPTKEEEDDEYLNAAIGTSHRGELRVKVDGKRNTDQKANTPRSKHSATEQRRRCKINDRFQALREIIPHGDQKRDKASFLLEVIEYIQFLQEKVSRYESPYPPGGWSGSEPPKPTSWRNSSNLAEGFPDQPRSAERPVLTFGTKEENLFLSTTVTRNDTTDPAGADIHRGNTNNNNAVAFNGSMDQRNTLTNKAVAPSVSLVPEVFPSFSNTSSDNGAAMHSVARKIGPSDADNKTSLSQLQLWHSRQHQQHHQQQQQRTGQSVRTSDNDLQQHQELAVEGGTINISSIYSQGLLNTLTQALQSSGVDLSQASISVQVDVGKRAGNGLSAPTATTDSKDGEVKGNGRALVRERGVESSSGCGDPDQATTKRLKKTVQPH